MKRFMSLVLSSILILGLTSCTSGDNPEVEKNAVVLDSEIKGELTVSTFFSSGQSTYLNDMAKAFEAKYPDTKINISSFYTIPEVKVSESEEGQTIAGMDTSDINNQLSEYTKQLGVDLISGEGADIYFLDNLPMKKYVDQGYLEDFNLYMEADKNFDKSKYYENIFKATEYKGGLYALPMDFMYVYLSVDKDLFTEEEIKEIQKKELITVEEMIELGVSARENEGGENKTIAFRPFSTLVADIVIMGDKKFLDFDNKKCYFDTGEFSSILTKIKEYEDAGYLLKDMPDFSQEINLEEYMNLIYAKNPIYFSNALELIYEVLLQMDGLDPTVKASFESQFGSRTRCGLLANEEGSSIFSPTNTLGINANSENKTLAWEFSKFLIDEEAQSSTLLQGIPVLKSSVGEKAKYFLTVDFMTGVVPENEELTEAQQKALDSYIEIVNSQIPHLKLYQYQDITISEALSKSIESFHNGEQTADEAAKSLQSAVELYLNE